MLNESTEHNVIIIGFISFKKHHVHNSSYRIERVFLCVNNSLFTVSVDH